MGGCERGHASVFALGDGMTDLAPGDEEALPRMIKTVLAVVNGGGLGKRVGKTRPARKRMYAVQNRRISARFSRMGQGLTTC